MIVSLFYSKLKLTTLALVVYSRSPAFRALKDLGILHLPCDKTLGTYMRQNVRSSGINEESIRESSRKYDERTADKVKKGTHHH